MNKLKSSGLIRLFAFFLVAVLMICTFGFATDGWHFEAESSDGNNFIGNDDSEHNQNTDKEQTEAPGIYIPEYINSLTGIETDEATSRLRPISIVFDSSSPLYGISNSDVLIEMPIENGQTRLVAVKSSLNNMWKIGSLTCTRDYISNIAYCFDSIVVSSGNDDSVIYESIEGGEEDIFLSVEEGGCYNEYSYYKYTNLNLLNATIASQQLRSTIDKDKSLPFNFIPFGESVTKTDGSSTRISVVYSQSAAIEFNYSADTKKYTMSRNGTYQIDLLTGESIDFDNCFILFADSVTYEGNSSLQIVINTLGSGDGLYFTNGSFIRIKWQIDADNGLILYDDDGLEVSVNRGTSYIGFVKSSRPEFVTFS